MQVFASGLKVVGGGQGGDGCFAHKREEKDAIEGYLYQAVPAVQGV